jgi:hypothetical protein
MAIDNLIKRSKEEHDDIINIRPREEKSQNI